MSIKCCIKNCRNVWYPGNNITFHRFPKKEDIRKKWLEAIPTCLIDKIMTWSRICSAHFSSDLYTTCTHNFKNTLCENAVPTIFDTKKVVLKTIIDKENILDLCNSEILNKGNETSVMFDISTQTCKNMQNATFCSKKYRSHQRMIFKHLKKCKEEISKLQKQQKEKRKIEKILALKKDTKKEENVKKEDSQVKDSENIVNNIALLEEAIHKLLPNDKKLLILNELRYATSNLLKPTYNDSIKDFATTLYFYSPKAYELVREKLTLPHAVTLRKWMASHNCDPGFLQGPLLYLQKAVKEKENNYLRNVWLIMDAMAIRSQMIFDENRDKTCSTIDYGDILKKIKILLPKKRFVYCILF